jgi:WD40 repeat protein
LKADFIVAAASDGNVHLFDPRSNHNTPVLSRLTSHSTTKVVRACPVNPEPYFISSGYTKDGALRNICMFDYRMKNEVSTYTVPENGPTLLYPMADPFLPLFYLTGNGEGIRIFEVQNGTLLYNSQPKLDHQFVRYQYFN